jgi:hypothetical protein
VLPQNSHVPWRIGLSFRLAWLSAMVLIALKLFLCAETYLPSAFAPSLRHDALGRISAVSASSAMSTASASLLGAARKLGLPASTVDFRIKRFDIDNFRCRKRLLN